jgi:hypothetical protein
VVDFRNAGNPVPFAALTRRRDARIMQPGEWREAVAVLRAVQQQSSTAYRAVFYNQQVTRGETATLVYDLIGQLSSLLVHLERGAFEQNEAEAAEEHERLRVKYADLIERGALYQDLTVIDNCQPDA